MDEFSKKYFWIKFHALQNKIKSYKFQALTVKSLMMEVIAGIDSFQSIISQSFAGGGSNIETVVLVGNFDGIHRGHQALLTYAKSLCKSAKSRLVVLTFEPHPLKILHPQKVKGVLFSRQDQIEQLNEHGVDYLIVQKFDEKFAQIEASDFLSKLLIDQLQMRHLVIGHDFKFGKDRKGDLGFLRSQALVSRFQVHQVSPIDFEGAPISSSRIRQALVEGKVREAQNMLGRPYYVVGEIVRGDGRGRGIGFPTANVDAQGDLFLKTGVYHTEISFQGRSLDSITNVGKVPTFHENGKLRVETHILNFDEDIYGVRAKVKFLSFVREEKKFNGVEELKEQINADIKRVLSLSHEVAK